MSRTFTDSRVLVVNASRASAFAAVCRIGGDTGWYALNWLWKLRGFLDVLVGGIGLRKSGSPRAPIRVGDEVDFWRVERIEADELLRLKAEMILPGEAWLEFEVSGDEVRATIRQTATFKSKGLLGKAYWYAVLPFHALIFRGMLNGLARAAQRDRRAG